MISAETVKNIVEEWLAQTEYFMVDVQVSADNRIVVEIDHKDGVWIDDCVELSRFIESRLDREAEDFELEVGSAGIGQPFKVHQQWVNHIGKDVEVLTADGRKLKGVLTDAASDTFTLTVSTKKKLDGEKRPHMVEEPIEMAYSDVKYGKYVF